MAEATPEKKIANAMKAMDEGDFKKAYTAFKKLAAEIPDNADVWYYKAECGNYASGMFGAKVDVQEIMDAYKKAIELDGDRVDYYQSYGLFCISVNKYDEAEKAYCEAAETSPCPPPCTPSSRSSTTTTSWPHTARSWRTPRPVPPTERRPWSTCSRPWT